MKKETIELVKKMIEDGNLSQEIAEKYCPELKENEDERIRKWIIDDIRYNMNNEPLNNSEYKKKAEKAIAWLKKQGEPIDKIVKRATTEKQRVLLTETDGDAYIDWDTRSLQDVKLRLEYGLDYIKKLKKQSEQKPVVPKFEVGDTVRAKTMNDFVFTIKDITDKQYVDTNNGKFDIEGQDYLELVEQKPADKVEPKFKVGDWVIDKQGIVHQIANVIENVTNHTYGYDIVGGGYFNDNTEGVRPWTIQNVKEGDVLFYKENVKYSDGIKYERICLFNNLDNAFFTLTKTSNYIEEYDIDVNIDYPDNTIPATKEQKEILFMAIKEAGYVWDVEKKELKKIEQKSYGQREECFDCQFNYAGECKGSCQMKREEQKTADKVEPKFHKGDWIIHQGTENIYQVVARIDNQYQLKYGDNYTTQYCEDVDKCTRLWDITKDAKDGDVLYINNTMSESIMIYKSFNNGVINKYASYNKFGFEGENYLTLNDGYIIPTTKEQRDLLFQKMKEAGYKWDAKKKELWKIEQNFSKYEKPLLEKLIKAVYACAWEKVTCKAEGESKEEYAERWAEQFFLIVRDWADDYIDFTIQQKLRNSYEKGKADIIEKQGEQKPEVKYVYTKFRIGDVIVHGDDTPVRVVYIGSGSYQCESDDLKISCSFPIKEQDDWELVEQKFVWSEEDERERKRVIGLLEGWLSTFKETCYAEDCKCGIDWLKSLRPQKPLTNEEIEQAKKEYRDVALSKVDYIPEELTYDGGWDDAISYMKKSLRPQTSLETS